MYYTQLRNIKKTISRSRRYDIFMLCTALFFIGLLVYASFASLKALFFIFFPALLFVFSVVSITEHNRLINQLSRIIESNNYCKTKGVDLSSPKVSFFPYPEFKYKRISCEKSLGLILTDKTRKKYYYFFNETLNFCNNTTAKKITSRFDRELSLKCYEGTSIIHSIENDRSFINIKLGQYEN